MSRSVHLVVGALALTAALACAWESAWAASEVRVYVEPDSGVTDTDPIRLVVRVDGERQEELAVPQLPKMKNLKVVAGPSQSTQFSWGSGRGSSSTTTLSYTLLAEKPGPAEIPAFEIRVGSTTHRSEPIRLEIAAGQRGRPAPPSAGSPRAGRSSSAEVFVEARLGADEVWVGQAVPLTVTLYARPRVGGLNVKEEPSFSNFWVEADKVDPGAESSRTTLGGVPYSAYPLIRNMLVPSSAGEFELDPYVLGIDVRLSDGGIFSFGRSETVIRKTEPLKMTVKPLPAGAPEAFGGSVGTFEMQVKLDRNESRVDDAVALTVTLSGDGFLKSAPPPAIDVPPDIKLFPPKPTQRSSIRRGKLVSRKTWEWVLVPLAAGELQIPEVRFAYFDPQTGRYREARGDPLLLSVTRGEGPIDTPRARGGIQLQRTDIAFIKPGRGPLSMGRPRVHQQTYFIVLALMPLILLPAFVFVGRRRARLRSDRGLARSRKARTRARKALRSARRQAAAADAGTFHEQIARTLVDYVADRFDVASAGLTYDRLDELLVSRGVDAELRGRFRACLESADFARFVPSSGAADRRHEALDEAERLVAALEKAL